MLLPGGRARRTIWECSKPLLREIRGGRTVAASRAVHRNAMPRYWVAPGRRVFRLNSALLGGILYRGLRLRDALVAKSVDVFRWCRRQQGVRVGGYIPQVLLRVLSGSCLLWAEKESKWGDSEGLVGGLDKAKAAMCGQIEYMPGEKSRTEMGRDLISR